ncbi:ATP-binding cassette domain-containing protein [Desulfovibrio sp. OttesenSCG-928-M16]|nr:ATP-binding cassette domain-containing protein [Desulfovibrio sp. OttesenSCG-928-M16]
MNDVVKDSIASPALVVEGLVVEREKNGECFTLEVPRLAVCPGRILAVVGQSGCGKSTLLDALALVLPASDSQVFTLYPDTKEAVDLAEAGQKTLAAVRGRDMGYVLQSGGLLSFLSVKENILLPGLLLGMPGDLLRSRLKALAERLDIAGQLHKKPQHLSGGQRQRAAIVRALAHCPRIVFADEPTAAVDEQTAGDIFAVFRQIVLELGTALVVVSHDLGLVRRFADDIFTFELSKYGCNVASVLKQTELAA